LYGTVSHSETYFQAGITLHTDSQFSVNMVVKNIDFKTFNTKYGQFEQGELTGIALGYGLDNWGFESRQGLGIFLFTAASRPDLRPTQAPIQWVPVALSLGIKRLGREAGHSPPSSSEVKNAWSYSSALPIGLHGGVLNLKNTGTNLPFMDNSPCPYFRICELSCSDQVTDDEMGGACSPRGRDEKCIHFGLKT
jgi:hypothetical protein